MSDRNIQPSASWVTRRKSDGAVICEVFDVRTVRRLNTEVYEAIPILLHLGALNAGIAAAEKPPAGRRPDS